MGYAIKFVDEELGIVEGLGIPYHGPFNGGRDIDNEYFDEKTDFTSSFYDGKSIKSGMPALYHHGFDPDVKSEPIGEVIGVEDKPEGKWIKIQLNKAGRYYEGIKTLIKMGKLAFSSGAITEGVVKTTDGFIKSWPWKEESLTPAPANPSAEVKAFKSMIEDSTIESEAEKLAAEFNIPLEQAMAGMKEELEHTDVTGGDPVETAKIVAAHLKEDVQYYSKLEKVMNKNKEVSENMKAAKMVKPEGSPEFKQDENVTPESNGLVPGEQKAAPPECAKKSIKCAHCGKAIQLPPDVLQALTALRDSANSILTEGGGDAESQEPVPDAETPAETAAENKPEGDKPAAVSQPGIPQSMGAETEVPAKAETIAPVEEKKPDEVKAIKSVLDSYMLKVDESVKGAMKSLIERIDVLERMPAMPGPVRSSVKTADNPHMDIDRSNSIKSKIEVVDKQLADPGISPQERMDLSRQRALLEMPTFQGLV